MRMIADFEPVDSLWLCWPTVIDWPGKIDAARWAFVEFVRAASEDVSLREIVVVVPDVMDGSAKGKLRKGVGRGYEKIRFVGWKTDRCWMRDMSPTWTEQNGILTPVPWRFTGWGGGCSEHALDATVGNLIVRDVTGRSRIVPEAGTVMEGGAIDTNGHGTILTTRECLLHPTVQVRNPGFDQDAYERMFHRVLGIEQVIWLEGGIAGDDTHGHVDDVARFVGPIRILCTSTDPGDENESILKANLEVLRQADNPAGTWNIEEVPLPTVIHDGNRLPASYMNFLILNDRVLVPTFNHVHDAEALRIIGKSIGRRAVGVCSVDLVLGGGSLHCLSHTVPRLS